MKGRNVATILGLAGLCVALARPGPCEATVRHPSWQAAVAAPVQAEVAGPIHDIEMPAPASATNAPVAVAAHVFESAGSARLVFDLSAKVAVDAFVLDRPDRVIVDLPEVNFQVGPDAGRLDPKGAGLIRSFRFGLFAPGRSRIVIDLNGPASVRKATAESIAGGEPSRLTIELARTDRALFRLATHHAAAASAVPVPPAAAPAPKPSHKTIVVIDPGHGGIDPGASGIGGSTEKLVVLDFAAALAAKLTASGRYDVVMTRVDDSFVSLGDRVRIARDADAALLVSIHADTLSDAGVTGATVYTASDRASDAEAARVAETENHADEAAGVEAVPEAPGVSDILFDLTRRETRTYAHMFQRTLVGYWQKIARLNKNPERSAGFKVLQAPDVPSVLLELGYLSSDKDARMLTSPEWRDQATTTVAAAIDAFFARRLAPDAMSAPGQVKAAEPQVVSAQSHL